MDPVMRFPQNLSQTLICHGLLLQVMMSAVILQILRASQEAVMRKDYRTSSLVVHHPTHQQLSHLQQLRMIPVEVIAVGVNVEIVNALD